MSAGDDARNVPALTGAFNFRDLGGLPASGGRRTRPGLLFRSDTLQALTEADVAHLIRSLGVMLVMDLRDADEAVEQGRGLLGTSPLCYVNLPLEAAPTAGEAPAAASGGGGRGGATLDFYLGHLESASSVLPLALQILAVSLTRPAVVHCAAGKDRTGLVVALVLGIAGVSDEAIVADYMATAQNMPRINERFQTWPRTGTTWPRRTPSFTGSRSTPSGPTSANCTSATAAPAAGPGTAASPSPCSTCSPAASRSVLHDREGSLVQAD
jgi:hypothetical protein